MNKKQYQHIVKNNVQQPAQNETEAAVDDESVKDIEGAELSDVVEDTATEESNASILSNPDDYVKTTDTTGTSVYKPLQQESTVTMESKTAAPAVTSDRAAQMQQLIDVYLNFNNGDIMKTKEDTDRAGVLFREVLKFALDNPEIAVLNVLYKFFNINRDRILAPKYVMQSITAVEKRLAERLSCVYTMFRMLTGGERKINSDVFRHMLGSAKQDTVDMLMMYFEQKTTATR